MDILIFDPVDAVNPAMTSLFPIDCHCRRVTDRGRSSPTEYLNEELLKHLSTLKDAELLYERGIYPNSTYVFKHALTQEVVYDSILTRKKKSPS
jgi:hypothetical protein